MSKVAVIGFGNSLCGDDGVGSYVVAGLQDKPLPATVELIDGGLDSLAVLANCRAADKIIIVDALLGSGQPGDIYRVELNDLPTGAARPAYSLHDLSLLDALQLARNTGSVPPIEIYGVHPANLNYGVELTANIKAAAERLIAILADKLNNQVKNVGREEGTQCRLK